MRRAGFLALLALAGCRSDGPRPVDRRLAAFLPEDAIVLAGVRVDEAKASPLGAKLAALVAPVGAEPHDLLASWNGKDWLVAAQVSSGGTVGDVALAGPPEAVRAAVERQRAGRPGPLALLARAPAANIWAVSSGAPLLPGGPYAAVSRLLNAMEDITITVDLASGIRAAVHGNCRDERNAQIVADALRALAAVGKLEGVSVEQNGRSVNAAGALPREAAERLAERFIPR